MAHKVDPLVCPNCGEKIRILAVIMDHQESMHSGTPSPQQGAAV